MSKSRGIWDTILKVVIAVASAVLGCAHVDIPIGFVEKKDKKEKAVR